MSEFKVGDRVSVSSALYEITHDTGTVTAIGDDFVATLFLVDLDSVPGIQGSSRPEPGIWFGPSEMEAL